MQHQVIHDASEVIHHDLVYYQVIYHVVGEVMIQRHEVI